MGALDWEEILAGLTFTGARVSGLMVFAPFLNGAAIPMRVKAGLTVALAALLYPVYGPRHLTVDALGWTHIMLSEAMVGLLFGLAVQFIFDAAQLAGQILGVQMGFSLVSIFDPQTQADSPVLSIFHQLVVLLLFLQLNVHHWLMRGLAASFAYLPPGQATVNLGTTSELLRAAGGIWLAGVQIAAPALVATLLADVALGFLGKATPQLPVLLIGLSVKSMLGMVVLAVAVAGWPRFFERHFTDAIVLGERLLHLAKG
jgi:flagellar biosynthetic protein FliR